MARQPAEGRKEADRILGLQHAADEIERLFALVLEIGQRAGQRLGAMRVVSAVEPDLGALGRELDQRPAHQTLQPRRPFDRPQTGFDRRVAAPAQAPAWRKRGDRGGRIFDLMGAGQARQRQVEQAVPILIDHAAMLLMGEEILPEEKERRRQRIGPAGDDVARNVVLIADDKRHTRS